MTDLIASLETMLEELPEAVGRRKLGDRLNQSAEKLKSADQLVGRLTAILDLAELTGFGKTALQAETLSNLQEQAFATGKAFEAASTDGELRDAIDEYEHDFKHLLSSADTAIRTHWATLATHKFGALAPLGKLLQRIEVASDLARRLQDCGQRGIAPSHAGTLTDLAARARGLLAELEELETERASTVGEGKVGDFINALAEHRATLAMVTGEVRDWLEAHQALERFSITPRELTS